MMPEISSKRGGPRPNSGGPRPNSGGPRHGAGRPRTEHIGATHPPLGPRWYVIETFPQAERTVSADLARMGWRAYLPLTTVWRPDPVTPTIRRRALVPLFPQIMFVEFDRDSLTWGTIRDRCAGVRAILRGPGGKPAPVPNRPTPNTWTVEQLINDDQRRLNLREPPAARNKPRQPGSMCRITEGPLAHHTATVISCDGLQTCVAVQLLGRLVPIELATNALISHA